VGQRAFRDCQREGREGGREGGRNDGSIVKTKGEREKGIREVATPKMRGRKGGNDGRDRKGR